VDIRPVLQFINRHRSFLVTGHRFPEGDCLASTLAFSYFLKKIGKEVLAFNPDPLPEVFKFLPGFHDVLHTAQPNQFDAACIVDCPDLARVGEFGQQLRKWNKSLLNIDHHGSNTRFGEVNFIRPLAASSGEVVLEIVRAYGLAIDLSIAKLIYTSILCDTGGFRYGCTTRQSLELAGELIDMGVSPWEISENIYENEPLPRIRLLQETLASLVVSTSGRIASIVITQEIFKRTQTSEIDTDRLINFARSIRGVEVAVQFLEIDSQTTQITLRSKGRVHVGEICEHLSGVNGQPHAASCELSGNIASLRDKTIEEIEGVMELVNENNQRTV
jgi:phosphoesterase RecJ-like protein